MLCKIFACLMIFSNIAFSMDSSEVDFFTLQKEAKRLLKTDCDENDDSDQVTTEGFDFFNREIEFKTELEKGKMVEGVWQKGSYRTDLTPFPLDITYLIFGNLCRADRDAAGHTCRRSMEIINRSDFKNLYVVPRVKEIIDNHNGFRFCKINYRNNHPNGNNVMAQRVPPETFTLEEIMDLSSASNLGNGDACLMLAEMNWNSGRFQGREFLRYGKYLKALACKKSNGKNEVQCFGPGSEELNAVLFGIAYYSVRSNNAEDLLPFDKLERALNALLSTTDFLYFGFGGVASNIAHKLWDGRYVRVKDDERNSLEPKRKETNRKRTMEEKNRDFRLIVRLYRHAAALGARFDQFAGGSLDGIHSDGGHVHFHQFEPFLLNKLQTKNFIDYGRTSVMPD